MGVPQSVTGNSLILFCLQAIVNVLLMGAIEKGCSLTIENEMWKLTYHLQYKHLINICNLLKH